MLPDYMATPVIYYEGPEDNKAEYLKIGKAFLNKIKRCALPTQFGIYREILSDGAFIEVRNISQFDPNIGKYQHSHPVDVIKIIAPPPFQLEEGIEGIKKPKKLILKTSQIEILIIDIYYVCQGSTGDGFSIAYWLDRKEQQEPAHKNIYLFPGSEKEPPGHYYSRGNAGKVEGYYPILGDLIRVDQYYEKLREGRQNVTVSFSEDIQPQHMKANKIDFLKYSDNWNPVEMETISMNMFETFFPYDSKEEMYGAPTGKGYPWHWYYPAFAYYTCTKSFEAAGAEETAEYKINAGACHYDMEWVKQALLGTAAQDLAPNVAPTWPISVFSTADEGWIWRQEALDGIDPGESFDIDEQAISEDGGKAIYFCRRYSMGSLKYNPAEIGWERYTLVVSSGGGGNRYVLYENSNTDEYYRYVKPIECKIYDEYNIGLYSYRLEEGDVDDDGNYTNVVCTYHYGVVLFDKNGGIKMLTKEYPAEQQGEDDMYPQWHLFDEKHADWYGHGFFELTAKTLHDDYAWQEDEDET